MKLADNSTKLAPFDPTTERQIPSLHPVNAVQWPLGNPDPRVNRTVLDQLYPYLFVPVIVQIAREPDGLSTAQQ